MGFEAAGFGGIHMGKMVRILEGMDKGMEKEVRILECMEKGMEKEVGLLGSWQDGSWQE